MRWICTKIQYKLKYKNVTLEYRAEVENCQFGGFNWIGEYTKVINSEIGKSSYVASNTNIAHACIAKYCSIGPNVIIGPGKHPTSIFISTHPSFYSNPQNLNDNFFNAQSIFNPHENVKIGNDVWIGTSSIILDGITIGDGAIVAANSVVTKDVPPYAIVGGSPAKIIKYRFSESQINTLVDSKWWDKDVEWIKDNVSLFHSIDDFILFHKQEETI